MDFNYVGDDDFEEIVSGLDDDDDESGADYDESGARKKRRKGKNKGLVLQRLAQIGRLPGIYLGFNESVTANTSESVQSEPNISLRPTDLMVNEGNCDSFDIDDIKVGQYSMIAGSQDIPASIFSTRAVRPPLSSPVLGGGTNAVIDVANLSGADQVFRAALFCLKVGKHSSGP